MATNSMAALSEKLQQQLKADQEAVKNQTESLLKLHADSLKKLSDDALNTTRNATQRHATELEKLHSSTAQRLRWLMFWPLLSSVCLSILIVLAASLWGWWTVTQASSQSDKILSDQRMKLERMNMEFCNSQAGRKYCRPSQ